MKLRVIQSVLLVFILITPLVFQSVVKVGDFSSFCELCEEQKTPEQEKEMKEKVEAEKTVLNNPENILILSSNYFKHPIINKIQSSVNNEVFTPPPELI